MKWWLFGITHTRSQISDWKTEFNGRRVTVRQTQCKANIIGTLRIQMRWAGLSTTGRERTELSVLTHPLYLARNAYKNTDRFQLSCWIQSANAARRKPGIGVF